MTKLGFVSVLAAAYVCAAATADAQRAPDRALVLPAASSPTSASHLSRSLPASTNSAQKSTGLVWAGLAIGAVTGAVLGAEWGRHVDKQMVCPATGPCGGRSNVGPYALVGAGIGGLLGAVVGSLIRNR